MTQSRAGAVALAAALLVVGAARAHASDFWDEVRNPGLAAQRIHARRAREALAGNRAELALSEADAAIVACAACAQGQVVRGRALAALGRHGEAVVAFERALQSSAAALDAKAADALAAAFSASYVGRPEIAVSLLERLLARRPSDDPRALCMLADALQAQGPAMLRRAMMIYREAITASAHARRALLGLALALDRDGAHDEALALARRAAPDSDPEATGAWLPEPERAARLALWLSAVGDDAAAAAAWQHAAEGGGAFGEHARAARERALRAAARP